MPQSNQSEYVKTINTYERLVLIAIIFSDAEAEANIVQNLGQDDRSAIEQALALARDAIASAEEIAEEKRHELVEIVDEATNELGRENPNSTKLQSLLATVASTIQTLASAQPAYQALKGALIPLGIMLP